MNPQKKPKLEQQLARPTNFSQQQLMPRYEIGQPSTSGKQWLDEQPCTPEQPEQQQPSTSREQRPPTSYSDQQPSTSGEQRPPTPYSDQQPSTSGQQPASFEPSTSDAEDEEVTPGSALNRSLYSEEVRGMWNLVRVYKELGTKDQCISFAEDNELLPKAKICNTHKVPMVLSYASNSNSNMGQWNCSRRSCKAKSKISRAKNTFFENIRIDIRHVFYLMYAFAHKFSIKQTLNEDPYKNELGTTLSWVTVTDWFNYCRESVVEFHLQNQNSRGKIGGPGKVVQIDESKFGKRKYNKGRAIEGHWVLGLIEDGSEDLRLEVCPDNVRSAAVLVPLIQKHVEVGTTIHTDYWRAYDCLGEHGYIHKKVNHSDPDNPFVGPDGTHTQRIESQWRVVKLFFKQNNYTHTYQFADNIIEYLWRRSVNRNKKDPFIDLIKAIKYIYKVS